jgi:hypothetical protein
VTEYIIIPDGSRRLEVLLTGTIKKRLRCRKWHYNADFGECYASLYPQEHEYALKSLSFLPIPTLFLLSIIDVLLA